MTTLSIAIQVIAPQLHRFERLGDIEDAKKLAEDLKNAGFIAKQHTGEAEETFDADKIARWLVGSLIDIVENATWYAMNSWINCIDKFLPGCRETAEMLENKEFNSEN